MSTSLCNVKFNHTRAVNNISEVKIFTLSKFLIKNKII